jgi:hypothetical protein
MGMRKRRRSRPGVRAGGCRGHTCHRARREPAGLSKLGQIGLAYDRQFNRRSESKRRTHNAAGTIYNYGPDAFPVLREESPQNATTHKGRIRIELEKRLKDASRHGVRSLIVRFGDFFGPKPGNNWFSQGMISPGGPL